MNSQFRSSISAIPPMPNRVPLILAIVLLCLPLLYVASYLGLVTPTGTLVPDPVQPAPEFGEMSQRKPYRIFSAACEQIFWPLERMDRTLRPAAWEHWLVVPPLDTWDYSEERPIEKSR